VREIEASVRRYRPERAFEWHRQMYAVSMVNPWNVTAPLFLYRTCVARAPRAFILPNWTMYELARGGEFAGQELRQLPLERVLPRFTRSEELQTGLRRAARRCGV